MLIVKQAERGPRVVALQILLNRHRPRGVVLDVDGAYENKTAIAIQAYRGQEMSASGRGDIADSVLWLHLINRQPLQVIDAVDVSDPQLLEFTVPALEDFTKPIVTGAMSNGLNQFMLSFNCCSLPSFTGVTQNLAHWRALSSPHENRHRKVW